MVRIHNYTHSLYERPQPEVSTNLHIHMTTITFEQVCVVWNHPLVGDNATARESGTVHTTPTVYRISISYYDSFTTQLLGETPVAIAQSTTFISTTSVPVVYVTLRVEHVFGDQSTQLWIGRRIW